MKPLKRWLLFAVFSVVMVPLGVFLGGWWLAGPYEGDNGFIGMLGELYGDALRGRSAALVLLFSPVLLAGVWVTAWQARRLIDSATAQREGSQ